MMRVSTVLAMAVLCVIGGGTARSEPVTASYESAAHGPASQGPTPSYLERRAPAFMKIFGPAQPPYGFVRFCDANPEHCAQKGVGEARIMATPERLIELDEINRHVNESILPLTDQEIYGVNEYWTLPDKYGDCEDYVLLKRKLLINRGWPRSALLITVVRDENGDGHAVLTARTTQGDFILDNKVTNVRIWSSTPYQYVMRQSYVNPRVWVSLEETLIDQPLVMSGAPAADRD